MSLPYLFPSVSSIPVLHQHSHGVLSLSSHMDSYCLTSLPASLQQQHQSSICPAHPVPNFLSVTWPSFHSPGSSYSAYLPCESHVMVRQCSCPVLNSTPAMGGGGVSRLRHSNSAPSIGTSNHRRHSLQPLYSMTSDGQIFSTWAPVGGTVGRLLSYTRPQVGSQIGHIFMELEVLQTSCFKHLIYLLLLLF